MAVKFNGVEWALWYAEPGDAFVLHNRLYEVVDTTQESGRVSNVLFRCSCTKCGKQFDEWWNVAKPQVYLPARCTDCRHSKAVNLTDWVVGKTIVGPGRRDFKLLAEVDHRCKDGRLTKMWRVRVICPGDGCTTQIEYNIPKTVRSKALKRKCDECNRKARATALKRNAARAKAIAEADARNREKLAPKPWGEKDVKDHGGGNDVWAPADVYDPDDDLSWLEA